MDMKTHTPCFSLGLDSPSNRSGNNLPAILLNLFWRSDITPFPTSMIQTDGFFHFDGGRTEKGFRELWGLNLIPFLLFYRGKAIIRILPYDGHKQALSSASL